MIEITVNNDDQISASRRETFVFEDVPVDPMNSVTLFNLKQLLANAAAAPIIETQESWALGSRSVSLLYTNDVGIEHLLYQRQLLGSDGQPIAEIQDRESEAVQEVITILEGLIQ